MAILLLLIFLKWNITQAKDVTKYPGVKAQTLVTCKPGQFAIFWPQDGHQPCIGSGDIHKAIFKVKD